MTGLIPPDTASDHPSLFDATMPSGDPLALLPPWPGVGEGEEPMLLMSRRQYDILASLYEQLDDDRSDT